MTLEPVGGPGAQVTDEQFGHLWAELNNLHSVCEQHFTYFQMKHSLANRLIAHNMFAIVRLEIGTAIDQITNDALYEKRTVTGSGNFKLVCNVASSVAIMAGNVFSGGGMTIIGGAIVGGVSMVQAAINNDPEGAVGSLGTLVGTGISAGRADAGQNFDRSVSGDSTTTNTGAVSNSASDTVNSAGKVIYTHILKRREAPEKPKTYKITKNSTFFNTIKYGNGGANAITRDVQDCITKAYEEMCDALVVELNDYAKLKIGETANGEIIKKLYCAYDDLVATGPSKGLHPLTIYVLGNGLEKLYTTDPNDDSRVFLSGKYGELEYGGVFPDLRGKGAQTLLKAKMAVLKSYKDSRQNLSTV